MNFRWASDLPKYQFAKSNSKERERMTSRLVNDFESDADMAQGFKKKKRNRMELIYESRVDCHGRDMSHRPGHHQRPRDRVTTGEFRRVDLVVVTVYDFIIYKIYDKELTTQHIRW